LWRSGIDALLYRRSDIYNQINRGESIFFNDNYLLGDLAYKLIVGFKDNSHLSEAQKRFNKALNKIRVKIENAFALLKCRFRRLKYLENVRLDLANLLIVSACILHNVCLLNEDLVEVEEEGEQDNANYFGYVDEHHNEEEEAVRKRQGIVDLL